VVSSVIDLLLCTLFNIEAATVVTLSVVSYPIVFAVYHINTHTYTHTTYTQHTHTHTYAHTHTYTHISTHWYKRTILF